MVVVYCYTRWCGYCRKMTPLIERAAASKEFEGIMFYKVNVDDVEVPLLLCFSTPVTLPTT